jgi:hypothetical protein
MGTRVARSVSCAAAGDQGYGGRNIERNVGARTKVWELAHSKALEPIPEKALEPNSFTI